MSGESSPSLSPFIITLVDNVTQAMRVSCPNNTSDAFHELSIYIEEGALSFFQPL